MIRASLQTVGKVFAGIGAIFLLAAYLIDG